MISEVTSNIVASLEFSPTEGAAIRIEGSELKELPVGSTIKVEVQNSELGVRVGGEFEALPKELAKVVKAGDEFRVIPNGAARLVVAEKPELKEQQKLVDLLGLQDNERANLAKLVTESSMQEFSKAVAEELPSSSELQKQEVVLNLLKNFAELQEAPDTAKPLERLQVLLNALESTASGDFKSALKEVINLQTSQLSGLQQKEPSVQSYNELLKTLPEPRPELRLSENPTLKEIFQVFSKVSEEANKADAPQVYKLLESNLLAIANEKLSETNEALKEVVTEPKQLELLQKLTDLNLIPKTHEQKTEQPLERLEIFSKALEASSSGNFKVALQEIINLQPNEFGKVYQKLLTEQPALQSYNDLVKSLPVPKSELLLSENPSVKELQEVFSKITNDVAKEQPELAKLLEAKLSAVVFEKLLTEDGTEAKGLLHQMLNSPNQDIILELENVLPKITPQKNEGTKPLEKLETILRSFENTVSNDFRKALENIIDAQINKLIESTKLETVNSQSLKELLANVNESSGITKPETINLQILKELLTSLKENIENVKPETIDPQKLKDLLTNAKENIENLKPEALNSKQLQELLTNVKESLDSLKTDTIDPQKIRDLLANLKESVENIKPETVDSKQLKELLLNLKETVSNEKPETINLQNLKELLTNLKDTIENVKPETTDPQNLKDLLTKVKESIENLKPETIDSKQLKELLANVKDSLNNLKPETLDPQKLKDLLVNVKDNIEKIDIAKLIESRPVDVKETRIDFREALERVVPNLEKTVSKNVEAFNELLKNLPIPKPELSLSENPSINELGEVFKKLAAEVVKDPVTYKPLEDKLVLATFEKLLLGNTTKEALNEVFSRESDAEKLKSLIELKALLKSEDVASKQTPASIDTVKPFAELETLLKTLNSTVNGNFREALDAFLKLQPTAMMDKFQELLQAPPSIATFNELVKELGLPELTLSETPNLKEFIEIFSKIAESASKAERPEKPLEAMFMTLALENLLTEEDDTNTAQVVRDFFSEPEKAELLKKLVNLNLIPKSEDGTAQQVQSRQTVEQILKTLEGAVTNDFRKALEDVIGTQTERLVSEFKATVPAPTVDRYNEIVRNLPAPMPELSLADKPSVSELLQVFSKLEELVQKEPTIYKPLEAEFLTVAFEKLLTSETPATTEVLRNILSNPQAATELRNLIDLNITLKADGYSSDLLKECLRLLFAAEALENQVTQPSFKKLEHLFTGGVLDLQKPLQKIMREMLVSPNRIPDLQQLFDVSKEQIVNTKTAATHHRHLRNFLELSANVKQLNSIFRALGEPTYYFYPVLVGTNFSLLELTYFPLEQLMGDKIRQKRRKRLKAKTNLENLGTVEVDASYCDDEVDIDFIFEEERSSNFAKRYLSLLQNRLASLGYSSVKLRCRTEKTEDIAPVWVRELGREVCLA